MLDHYLELSYQKEKKASDQRSLVELLKQLPNEELFKLATGRSKLASDEDWINQFKGTPYFEQAVALEQEQLQLELQDLQKREETQVESNQRDTIEVRKKLLSLQAASEGQSEQDMAEEEMAVQEEAPSPEPAPTVKKTTVEEKPASPEAPAEPKVANALSLGAKALGFAKANPGMVAGAIGGAGMGAAQGEGVGGRLTGALGGAVGGAALGGAAQVGVGAARTLARHKGPLTLDNAGRALKGSYNNQVRRSAAGMGYSHDQARGMMLGLKPKPGASPAAAAGGAVAPAAPQQPVGLLPAPKA